MSDSEFHTPEEKPKLVHRLLPMLILALCFALAESLLYLIALIQLVWVAFDGGPNKQILSFSKSLAEWLRANAQYLSFATEEKPFPWNSWPKTDD